MKSNKWVKKMRKSKGIFVFDCVITVVILIWTIKSFLEGENVKGMLFIACFALMTGVLFTHYKQRKS